MPKQTVLVFMDGYDSLFVQPASQRQLVGAYHNAQRHAAALRAAATPNVSDVRTLPGIIGSADVSCRPRTVDPGAYPAYTRGVRHRYLSAGLLVGYAGEFRRLFEAFPLSGSEASVQHYFASALLAGAADPALPWVDVDYRFFFVATISPASLGDLSVGLFTVRVAFRPDQPAHQYRQPHVLHLANGRALLPAVSRQLWASERERAGAESPEFCA